MFQPVKFDQAEAVKANGGNNQFFDGNTEQLVKIVRAEFVKSKNTGATGIEFDLTNKDGLKGYFTIWHLKGDGSVNEFSYRQLQALMGVTGATDLTPTQVNVPKYDFTSKETVNVPCINAVELLGKFFVGLFIKKFELYNGEIKTKTELFGCFNQQRQSSREFFANQPPQDIDRSLVAMIETSEKSHAEAERKKNENSYGGWNNDTTDGIPNQFMSNTTYQKTQPAPQQPNFNNNMQGEPKPSTVDSDIPFNALNGQLAHLI